MPSMACHYRGGLNGVIMDMNDILNQWDQIQKNKKNQQKNNPQIQVSHKKANAPTKEEKELAEEKKYNNVNQMEIWLNKYGTIDKDKLASEAEKKSVYADKNYLINLKPEAILDLHGLHQDEAYDRLNTFISDCKHRGLKKVLIIHGKGIHTTGTDPVLGEVVRKFIEIDKRCGMSGHPKNKGEGGSGATWVLIK